MNPRLKIVIASFHAKNKGDEAQLTGLINTLAKLEPEAEVIILSDYPHMVTISPPQLRFSVVPWIIDREKYPFRCLPRKFDPLLCLLNIVVLILLETSRFIKYLRLFCNADLILFSPGGPYFGTIYIPHVMIHLLHLFLAVILRKPVAICAPSIGPFNGRVYRFLHRVLLNRVNLILLREEVSALFLSELRLKHPKIIVTADCSLLQEAAVSNTFHKKLSELGIKKGDKPLIGVSVASLIPHFHNYSNYKSILSGFVDQIIERLNATVVFFVMAQHDLPLTKEIISSLRNKDKVLIIPPKYTSSELERLLSFMDLIIATRLHSYILAAKSGVPGVVIAYEHKAVGFMKMLGLSRFVIPIKELNGQKLEQAVLEAWSLRHDLSRKILQLIPQLKQRAEMNVILPLELTKHSRSRQR
jgi:colanic acid/amylovoran biosynthesis protein